MIKTIINFKNITIFFVRFKNLLQDISVVLEGKLSLTSVSDLICSFTHLILKMSYFEVLCACVQTSSSMADDLDIEAMLEAPYRKVRLCWSSVWSTLSQTLLLLKQNLDLILTQERHVGFTFHIATTFLRCVSTSELLMGNPLQLC